VEGMTRTEAIAALQDWSGPASSEQRQDTSERAAFALRLWSASLSLAGTLGERYLRETRGIDVTQLPPTIHEALRFHPSCPFGACPVRNSGRTLASMPACRRNRCSTRPERRCATPRARW